MSRRIVQIYCQGPAAVAEACRQLGLGPAPATAPLTAVALDVPLGPGDLAFHCDLVRVKESRLLEAPAVVIDPENLWALLGPFADRLTFELVVVEGPRALLIYRGGWPFDLRSEDPAALLGQPVAGRTIRGAGDEVMRDFIESGAAELGGGLQPWIWGGGSRPVLPKIEPAGVLSGGGLAVRGLARLIGWGWNSR